MRGPPGAGGGHHPAPAGLRGVEAGEAAGCEEGDGDRIDDRQAELGLHLGGEAGGVEIGADDGDAVGPGAVRAGGGGFAQQGAAGIGGGRADREIVGEVEARGVRDGEALGRVFGGEAGGDVGGVGHRERDPPEAVVAEHPVEGAGGGGGGDAGLGLDGAAQREIMRKAAPARRGAVPDDRLRPRIGEEPGGGEHRGGGELAVGAFGEGEVGDRDAREMMGDAAGEGGVEGLIERLEHGVRGRGDVA
jgi:hypothetical protein